MNRENKVQQDIDIEQNKYFSSVLTVAVHTKVNSTLTTSETCHLIK